MNKELYLDKNMIIGILSIQGDFAKHQEMLDRLGVNTLLVKTLSDLHKIDKLVIPGGESTTMRILLKKHNMWEELKKFCSSKPVFGTCAGAILLAHTINDGKEESLDVININVNRNSYGRQIDSFETIIDVDFACQNNQTKQLPSNISIPAVFIRAPQITQVANDVTVLAKYNQLPVLVQKDNILIATFHPELTDNTLIIDYFLHYM